MGPAETTPESEALSLPKATPGQFCSCPSPQQHSLGQLTTLLSPAGMVILIIPIARVRRKQVNISQNCRECPPSRALKLLTPEGQPLMSLISGVPSRPAGAQAEVEQVRSLPLVGLTVQRSDGTQKLTLELIENFPGDPMVKDPPANAGTQFHGWSRKIPHASYQLSS